MAFAAAASIYTAALIALLFGHFPHPGLVVLGIRYGALLPCVLFFVRGAEGRTTFALSPRLVIAAAAVFAITAVFVSWHVSRGLQIADESAYAFQARLFRTGHIKALPLPGAVYDVSHTPAPIYFEHHIQRPDGWFSKYPPGWPALLAIAGPAFSFLVNPILGIIELWLVWNMARAYGRIAAAAAVLMLVLSPYYMVWTTGMMSQASSGVALALSVYAWLRWKTSGSNRWLIILAAGIAMTGLIRPYTGLVAAFVLVCFLATEHWREKRRLGIALLVCAIGVAFAAVLTLVYNQSATGHALLSPYAFANSEHRLRELTLNLRAVLSNIIHNGNLIEDTLVHTFPFVGILAIFAFRNRWRQNRELRLLTALMPALFAAYLLNTEVAGGFYGNRFCFEGFFGMAIAAGVGFQDLLDRFHPSPQRLRVACAVLGVIQVVQFTGVLHGLLRYSEPYESVRAAAENTAGDRLVVFLRDTPDFTAEHFNLNAADWAGAREIFLVDPGPAQRGEWAARLGRTRWVVLPAEDSGK